MRSQITKGFSLKLKNLGILFLFSISLFSFGCNKEENNENKTTTQEATPASAAPQDDGKGIGPIKEVKLSPEIDLKIAAEGQKTFQTKCSACHKFEAKYVGPALNGITQRRKPEWIMNMIMNPAEMIQKDPTAKKLFSELLVPMANLNIKEPEARSVLEFFRAKEKGQIK